LVRPIPANRKLPELTYSTPFLESNSHMPLRQPGIGETGPEPIHPPNPSMPVEQLMQQLERAKGNPAPQTPNPPPLMMAPGAGASTSGGAISGGNPNGGSK
jgi:hypothetical protein